MYKIIGADGKEYGPVSLVQLRQWLAEGRVNAQTRILAEGDADWKTIASLPDPGLGSSLSAAPRTIPPLTTPLAFGRPLQQNNLAVTGLILGIISLVMAFCCCGGLPLNLLGIILCSIGLTQINRQPDVYTGKGVAIAGLIISCASLLLGIGIMILSAALNWDEIARQIEQL